jgi:hypothetical protein
VPQKQQSLLGGSHEDIPEEADDPDLGVNTSCGEPNGEKSRLGENWGERFKQGEESGEPKVVVEDETVLLRFSGLSVVTNPGCSLTLGGQD